MEGENHSWCLRSTRKHICHPIKVECDIVVQAEVQAQVDLVIHICVLVDPELSELSGYVKKDISKVNFGVILGK